MILISTGLDSRFEAISLQVFWGQICDGDDHDAGTGAVDLVRDIGDRSEHTDSVVAQVTFVRVIIDDPDGRIFAA